MVALEAILAVCGIICIIASYLIPEEEQQPAVEEKAVRDTSLSELEKNEIRRQVSELVNEELSAINERTEASLDKISNTKILEMNDYADTVMGEINKSHNEAVFLYDMLNEKAKEVKNTVKDVNLAKHEVKRLQDGITSESQQLSQADALKVIMDSRQEQVADLEEENLENNPENILRMYKRGISVKEIARKLGIGVGEVSLVVGLYEKEKQMQ
jgi:hypothetical protein